MTILQFNQLDPDSIQDIGLRFKFPQSFTQSVIDKDIFVTTKDEIPYQVVFEFYERQQGEDNSILRLFLQSPQDKREVIYCYDILNIKDVSDDVTTRFDIHILTSTGKDVITVDTIPLNQDYVGSNADFGAYTTPKPIPIDIGGIKKGSVFTKKSFNQVFDALFYPGNAPIIDTFSASPSTLQLGQVLDTLTVGWNISNGLAIKDNSITLTFHGTTLASRLNRTGNQVYALTDTYTVPVSKELILSVVDINTNEVVTKTINIEWKRDLYYGSSKFSTLTGVDDLTQVLTNTSDGLYNFNTIGYKYFLIPSKAKQPVTFIDTLTNFAISMTSLQPMVVTNNYGTDITYNVYRTSNQIHHDINILVKGE